MNSSHGFVCVIFSLAAQPTSDDGTARLVGIAAAGALWHHRPDGPATLACRVRRHWSFARFSRGGKGLRYAIAIGHEEFVVYTVAYW
jgi:hypothetical protein